jgi:hypothetical protein
MAERLVTLLATQVARVQYPVPARPTFSVEKWLFSVTMRQGARSQALPFEIIKWVKKFAVAKIRGDLRLD